MSEFPFKPRVVVWELTLRCNMNCLHCGSRAGQPRPNELTEAEGFSLIDQLLELGAQVVTLSGGEPFLHPSWAAYARRFADGGARVYVITNGLLLQQNVEALKAAGVHQVGLSVDGLEATHNHIRQHPRSFAVALEGAEAVLAAGMAVAAVTHVSRANFGDLEGMYALFAERRFTAWQLQLTFKQGRMNDHDELSLSPEEVPRVVEFVQAKQALDGPPRVVVGDNVGYYCSPPIRDKTWKGCFAGRHLVGIESDGGVKGCLSLPGEFVEGNVRDEPLRAIWEDPQRFVYNRYFTPDMLEGGCVGCDKALSCRGGCTVTAVSATGKRFDNPYCVHRLRRSGGEPS